VLCAVDATLALQMALDAGSRRTGAARSKTAGGLQCWTNNGAAFMQALDNDRPVQAPPLSPAPGQPAVVWGVW